MMAPTAPEKGAAKAKRTLLAIEVPRDELALRIGAKCIGLRPIKPLNATEELNRMNQHPGASGDGMGEGFRRAADAAIAYFHECVNGARQPS
jgi:hypothetical protein